MQQIEEIKKYTDRRIVIRPHPRSQINQNNFPLHTARFQIPVHLADTYDNFDINFSFHLLLENCLKNPITIANININKLKIEKILPYFV